MTILAPGVAQNKKPRKKLKEWFLMGDSLRLQLRQSADKGRMLQWGDSLLAANYYKVKYDTNYITHPNARWTIKMRGNL